MRILVAETLDPDGAMARWASPDLIALGHEVLPLPTQELAPLLGAHGLGLWIEAVAERFRPDLVIVCTPYEHAPAATWDRCRALGAKVVAFAMDEPLFAGARVADVYDAALRSFDRLYATAPEAVAALAARGHPARWLRWALSPSEPDPAALDHLDPDLRARLATSAVLIGRPYARRIALVGAVAERVPVHVFGHGWEAQPAGALGHAEAHGPLTGDAMHALLGHAGAVITTGDWESTPIAMVKVRLLEAAFAGAVQVAQRSADLDAYFPADEVPRFDHPADLADALVDALANPSAARAAAARARARAHREHTWKARFAELTADLGLPAPASNETAGRALRPQLVPQAPGGLEGAAEASWGATDTAPAVYRTALAAAAIDAERRGAHRLALTLHRLGGDLFGEARAALPIDPRAAADAARAALRSPPTTATGLYARTPNPSPGVGHVGFLDPSPELEAIQLTALLAAGDVPGALAAVTALVERGDPDRLVATAAILAPDGVPAHAPVWRALFSAALAANPRARDLLDEHRDRFTLSVS